MSTARRSIIRSATKHALAHPQRQRQFQSLRARLERERAALARWQTRLKRAFNAVQKCQKRITGLERQLTKMEDS